MAVAGAGAFGRNHLRVLRELEAAAPDSSGLAVALIAAVEPNAERAAEIASQYAIPVFASVGELLSADLHLDAAIVAVPTVHHHAVASELISADIAVLVEKPLAATLAEADDLIRLAEKHNRILQPGHLERFNPAVLAIAPRLRRPMFFEAHRLSIFTPRSLDVDVVLDLMIHDLDIVLAFTHSPVREVRAVGLPILSPKTDIANVRVEFESGCVANFTASRVSSERVRKLRFFEPRQYVSIDYARRELLIVRMDAEAGLPPEIAAALASGKVDPALLARLTAATAAGPGSGQGSGQGSVQGSGQGSVPESGPAPGLTFSKPPVEQGEPLKLEMISFLNAVRRHSPQQVTAQQGRAALELALAIQASMAAHAQRAGLGDFFKPAG